MMPNVKGPVSTRNQIMLYSLALFAIATVPLFSGLAGDLYAICSIPLNLGFVTLAFKVWRSQAGGIPDKNSEASLYAVKVGDRAARNLFAYSIVYLFAIFGVLAAEALLV